MLNKPALSLIDLTTNDLLTTNKKTLPGMEGKFSRRFFQQKTIFLVMSGLQYSRLTYEFVLLSKPITYYKKLESKDINLISKIKF